jgi:rhodanese-related sulfurtransferase
MENTLAGACITINDLKKIIDSKLYDVKIIDVRSIEEFNESHIPEAIHFELINFNVAESLFKKTDILITTCGKGGGRSISASEKLKELGFTNSKWLCGGTIGWLNN